MSMDDFKDENWNNLDLESKKTVLQQLFSQEKWGKLTREQRVTVAEHLGSYSEAVLGMPQSSVPVNFGILPAGYTGGYNPVNKEITLSYDLLSNDKKADLINSIFHENRHVYQAEVVKNPGQYLVENQEQIAKWRENQFPCYAGAASKIRYMYITQAIERDAFAYGDKKTDDFFNSKVFDAERSDYQKCKTAWKDDENEWKDMAASKLGNDYIRKTDIKMKGDYLDYQLFKVQAEMTKKKLSPQDKDQYLALMTDVRKVSMLSALELKRMDQQKMQDMEQRLGQVEQKLADFQKQWGINLNSKNSGQSVVRADLSSDSVLSSRTDKTFEQTHPVKIGEVRAILNGRMDEIIAQQKELNRERDLIQGRPLTKAQAEVLAASDYVKRADKQLAQKAQEFQSKREELIQTEKKIIAYGKEHGFDKTLWKKAPEIFKGEGLKYYESSLSIIENNKKVFDRQETEIQMKRAQIQERLSTPEAHSFIAKRGEEYLAKDKERLAMIEPLDRKLKDLNKERRDIIDLKNAIPSRNLERKINIQGNVKEIKNVLGQNDQITQQLADMQQTRLRTSSRSLSR